MMVVHRTSTQTLHPQWNYEIQVHFFLLCSERMRVLALEHGRSKENGIVVRPFTRGCV